ncbi:hypothetical protein N0V90_009433 [Kalmusia sp. IMI 367209]|nr:hypothetical protein N0V90_009433 [Kalmusia sp. IMI 367209]
MATYETAEDQYITIRNVKYAYRHFGAPTGTPLFLHMHFRGTMDHWDPTFINPLASRRPILLLDNAGVGRSEGTIPTSYSCWAFVVIDFLLALKVDQVDVLGFSMGGCTAQMIALNAPKGLVRRLVLAGTMTSVGEGTVRAPDIGPFNLIRTAVTKEEQLQGFLTSFFGPSERSQAAGRASFGRIYAARKDRTDYVSVEDAARQGLTYANFQDPEKKADGSYERFHELTMPVLIANGNEDVLLPTPNSILMFQKLQNANAQLHLYPDSGHGFLYQYAAEFSKLVNDFLDDEDLTPVSSHL